MPKPLCFMIMPYGRKATQAEAGRGVPEIDFNALWDRAFAPAMNYAYSTATAMNTRRASWRLQKKMCASMC